MMTKSVIYLLLLCMANCISFDERFAMPNSYRSLKKISDEEYDEMVGWVVPQKEPADISVEDVNKSTFDSPENSKTEDKEIFVSFQEKLDNVVFTNVDNSSIESRAMRRKRVALNWPARSRFFGDFYISIPMLAPKGIILPLINAIRMRFNMPDIDFTEFNTRRALDEKIDILTGAEKLANIVGLDGHECVLRAICERAEFHFLTEGLLAEILAAILVTHNPEYDNLDLDYIEAHKIGKTFGNCFAKYNKCPVSIFKWLDDLEQREHSNDIKGNYKDILYDEYGNADRFFRFSD